MPNIKSAKKRMRQNEVRRQRNRARKTRMRSAVRRLEEAIDAGDTGLASERWQHAQAVLDRSAQLGVIHPNTAARRKSRLARRLSSLSG